MKLTKEHAKEIIYTHSIIDIFENEEEFELLKENNPFLLEAYTALYNFAFDK